LSKRSYLLLLLVGLGVALLVTLFSPLASSEPDGLERVAGDKAFLDKGKDAPYEFIAVRFPWVENEDVATILAGVVGVLVVTAFVFGVGRRSRPSRGGQRPVRRGNGLAPPDAAAAGWPARAQPMSFLDLEERYQDGSSLLHRLEGERSSSPWPSSSPPR
jgi:hypothetical protein